MVLEVKFMWNKEKSTTLSIVVCFIFLAILTVGLFIGPWAVSQWFSTYRGFAEISTIKHLSTLFVCCFYPCAIFAYITLYSLIRLLFNIKKEEIFIAQNVKYLRRISWCCFVVAFITLIGGIFYIPFSFVAIAAAFIGLMLRIVKNVMQNAIELKTENELTI